jgi:hypothetical protein
MDPTLERMKADLDNSRISTDKGAVMRQKYLSDVKK